MDSSLALYRQLDRVGWLQTYARKVLFVAFVGTHIPLIGLIIYLTTRFEPLHPSAAILVTLISTLAGTFGVLWTLDRLLAPIRLATTALTHYLDTGRVDELPSDLQDEAGTLLRDVNRSVHAFEKHRCELERSAQTDALTGLWNRRGLEAQLSESGLLAANPSCCVAILDIDHFKAFNDSWGHPIGDLALREIAKFLLKEVGGAEGVCKTAEDIPALIARWGGEEFLAILPMGACDAYRCLERLRAKVPMLQLGAHGTIPMAISIGFTASIPGETLDATIARADEALYRAKTEGRNCVRPLPEKRDA